MKYRYKLMLIMVSLIGIIFGIGSAVIMSMSFNQILEEEIQLKLNNFELLCDTANIAGITETSLNNRESYIKKACDKSCVLLQIDGKLIYSNEEHIREDVRIEFEDIVEERETSNISYKIIGKNGLKDMLSNESKSYLQISGTCIIANKETPMDAMYDISKVYSIRYKYIYNYSIIFSITFLLSIFIAYALSYSLTRNISSLAKTTKQISKGDLKTRSQIKSRDEIGELALQFNNMTDSLVNQMEKMTEFMANFTHEMKTPMTSIIGYADLIRGMDMPDEEVQESANFIFKEGKRLERLSQKMLTLMIASNDVIKLDKASPSEIINSIAKHLEAEYAQEQISLNVKCEEGRCYLEQDYFASLIRNVLENAKRSIGSNGGSINIFQKMTKQGCHIVIEDTGCGMSEHELAKITDAFYRVDKARSRKYGGAGLGLAICKQIVLMHNGTMEFESKEGEGTKVIIELKGGIVNENN